MSKTAFYFRTVDEFNKVFFFVEELNKMAQKKYPSKHTYVARVHSRYAGNPTADNKPGFIPKKIATKKKYVGIISGNKYMLDRVGIDPEKILKELKVEIVSKTAGEPKYTGEKSKYDIHIKNHKQFRKIVSEFNKRYGHGNWRLRGPKRLQDKLRALEDQKLGFSFSHPDSPPDPEKGIKVTVIVNEPNADIRKLLFKILLMT